MMYILSFLTGEEAVEDCKNLHCYGYACMPVRLHVYVHQFRNYIAFDTGFAAFMTVGLFADFYLWDMSPRQVFVDATLTDGVSYEYLLRNESYQLQPVLHYSFGLQCGGK